MILTMILENLSNFHKTIYIHTDQSFDNANPRFLSLLFYPISPYHIQEWKRADTHSSSGKTHFSFQSIIIKF